MLALILTLLARPADAIVESALAQAREGARYDASYRRLSFPGGDVPADRGACTDVVIRALRAAGYDLQVLIYQDRRRRGLPTDRNIDHRRVRNQVAFFSRRGRKLHIDLRRPKEWLPGDFVVWKLPNGMDHIGVATRRRNAAGLPYVVHNIERTREEDVVGSWRLVGRYRFPR